MEPWKNDQGKSITTSVPSFAIRFHTEDEELEEIYPSLPDTDEEADKPATEDESLSSSTPQKTPSISASATTSTIHSRDPSPMKEYLKGFGKRSTSVDAGMIKAGAAGSSSDTWRIFHELKGKFTKTVEEKFSEIKSDRKPGSSVFGSGTSSRRGRLVAGGGSSSKDDSSMNSDSEDISESSKKNDDIVNESRVQEPVKSTHESPSKKMEGVLSAPEVEVEDITKSGLRKRKTEGVALSALQGIVEYEVESGVEAREDILYDAVDTVEDWERGIPTTDYRGATPFTVAGLPERIRYKRSLASKIWRWRNTLVWVLIMLVSAVIPISPYILGLSNGVMISVAIYAAYRKLSFLFYEPSVAYSRRGSAEMLKQAPVIQRPVIRIPAAKEYHQIQKYEGWMNEYPAVYDPDTYKVNHTQSVYVRLEGTVLKIYHTKQRIPKRAMWNERKHKMKFYHQRIYNIAYCDLKLLPEGLARPKLWSKKYPICIVLKKHDDVKCMNMYTALEDADEDDEYLSTAENLDRTQSASDISSLEKQPSTEDQEFVETLESEEDTFCHVELDMNCLYLFARTDREKELWYRKLATAIRQSRQHMDEYLESTPVLKTNFRDFIAVVDSPIKYSSLDHNAKSAEVDATTTSVETSVSAQHEVQPQKEDDTQSLAVNEFMTLTQFEQRDYDYLRFMTKTQQHAPPVKSSSKHEKVEAEIEREVQKPISPSVMWVNALIGRVVFDIMNNPFWHDKIKDRIQRKLSSIKLPYFIEELTLTEMDLGHSMPIIHEASRPVLDERGVWVDLEITYDGSICCTLETKLNLMKIKHAGQEAASAPQQEEVVIKKPHIYDSDMDDSAESSDDEEENDEHKSSSAEEYSSSGGGSGGRTKAGTKVIRLVNKIAASKYFQHATEYKYIKNVMEHVSNTKLMLSVIVNGLVGTLVINIPPPPSDRLWYGFRNNPQIWLQTQPKFGERQVSVGHVTSWIEKKLTQEFQKKFVLPNMDDLVISPMSAALPE